LRWLGAAGGDSSGERGCVSAPRDDKVAVVLVSADLWRFCLSLSCGVMGAAAVPRCVGRRDGMPTGAPQRGQMERRAAISSRARRCLPQLQTNLIAMIAGPHHCGARNVLRKAISLSCSALLKAAKLWALGHHAGRARNRLYPRAAASAIRPAAARRRNWMR
jgi:hypothetical protein